MKKRKCGYGFISIQLMTEEQQKGTFCSDPESPLNQWKETATNNPDNRTYFAGKIVEIAKKIMVKFSASS